MTRATTDTHTAMISIGIRKNVKKSNWIIIGHSGKRLKTKKRRDVFRFRFIDNDDIEICTAERREQKTGRREKKFDIWFEKKMYVKRERPRPLVRNVRVIPCCARVAYCGKRLPVWKELLRVCVVRVK